MSYDFFLVKLTKESVVSLRQFDNESLAGVFDEKKCKDILTHEFGVTDWVVESDGETLRAQNLNLQGRLEVEIYLRPLYSITLRTSGEGQAISPQLAKALNLSIFDVQTGERLDK